MTINWVRKLHGNRNARCHFCISEYVSATEVCEKCSFVHKWSLLWGESSRKCKYMPDMKYGASNCIPLHMEHKVMISGTSWQLFCRKTQSFMLTLV